MLHFNAEEFAERRTRVDAELGRRGLDGMLVFAPESQYWLTGYDTFGYCFFQCLVLSDGAPVLLTRSADLRQAELTSDIEDIRIWKDSQDANPAMALKALLEDLSLVGKQLGVETDTHGLTAYNGALLHTALAGLVTLVEASDLFSDLRLIKSDAEIVYVRKAAELADGALDAGLSTIQAGADEGHILAAMQGAVFAGGGDYPGNEFIIGSSQYALLCRYYSGTRVLSPHDQLTLEWAGAYRHYHAAMMRTIVIGAPTDHQHHLQNAVKQALLSCEAELKPDAAMGTVYDAHCKTFDEMGLKRSRLNACGYALGARFSPSWMEKQMFYEGAETIIRPGMVFFLHMILMDSDTETAMCLGRTSLVTETGSEPLSRHALEMMCR